MTRRQFAFGQLVWLLFIFGLIAINFFWTEHLLHEPAHINKPNPDIDQATFQRTIAIVVLDLIGGVIMVVLFTLNIIPRWKARAHSRSSQG